MTRNSRLGAIALALLLGVGSGMRTAEARQVLQEVWPTNQPPVFNGAGGATFQDTVIGTQTVYVNTGPKTYVAGRTWSGTGWSLVIRRYDYETGQCDMPGGTLGDCSVSFTYPGSLGVEDYFVPVAMTIVQDQSPEAQPPGAGTTYILVTGYSPAPEWGNTDFRTVCFNGNLVMRWDHKFTEEPPVQPPVSVDEYPVGISASPDVCCVTGNTYYASWDALTVFYNVRSGKVIWADRHAGPTGSDDRSAGCWVTGTASSFVGYIGATMGSGTVGNAIDGVRYSWNGTAFAKQTQTRSLSGATLKANAMDGKYAASGRDYCVVAGKATGIDTSYMATAKFDFRPNQSGWLSLFNVNGQAYGINEAVAIKAYATEESEGSFGDFIAVAGYGLRDAQHGLDSLACLYLDNEASQSASLQWSAWLNNQAGDPAVNVFDTCTGIDIDVDPAQASNPSRYNVFVIGQRPVSATNIEWRTAVFTSEGVGNLDPIDKPISGNSLQLSGSASGSNIPLKLHLNPFGVTHDVVVTGNVYNGTTSGDDIATRRYHFVQPQ